MVERLGDCCNIELELVVGGTCDVVDAAAWNDSKPEKSPKSSAADEIMGAAL
jgi:hypothetical protein